MLPRRVTASFMQTAWARTCLGVRLKLRGLGLGRRLGQALDLLGQREGQGPLALGAARPLPLLRQLRRAVPPRLPDAHTAGQGVRL